MTKSNSPTQTMGLISVADVDLSVMPHPLSALIKGLNREEAAALDDHDHYKDKPDHDHYKDDGHEWERGKSG